MRDAPTRSGTAVLAGVPNAGKSTLLNHLVGEPLAITSPKPQTTRLPVFGLVTDDASQVLFVDPAGLLEPEYPMQKGMRDAALEQLRLADAIVYLHPATEGAPPPLADLVPGEAIAAPILTVLSKIDLLAPGGRPEIPEGALAISAHRGEGVDDVLAWCRAAMPPGPFRYEPDDLSTQPTRFFVAEFVREAALEYLHQEIPYALAAEVDEFREGSSPLYIRIVVYVERESQKRVVVGKGGETIRAIGSAARKRVEAFVGERVYLDLWVKTLPKWRASATSLRRFGFPVPAERSS